MLTFKNSNIIFISLLLVLIAVDIWIDTPVFLYPLLLVVYSLVLFYGCYFIRSGFFMDIPCSAKTSVKKIALSFDDGPATNYTAQILSILKANAVEATFFCIGKNVRGHEEVLQQLHDDGHSIGNHSFSHHFFFDLYSATRMLEELNATTAEIHRATGVKPALFRPPYGVMNPNLKNAINKANLTPIGWSIRSMDTVIKDKSTLLKKITKNIQPGDIILLHDTSGTTVAILPELIRIVKDKGFEIIRLDKMLHLKPYA